MSLPAAPVWLFDLDNTLHDASQHVFPHIHQSMAAYLATHLGLSEDDAARLRSHYWARYGATLRGMMKHHGTAPGHFLWHTHQFDNLAEMLVFEPALRALLRRLPGRKILFSNAPRHYACEVLRLMGLDRHFHGVSAIEDVGYAGKPSREGFARLMRAEKLNPAHCILVEDTRANLMPAKRLGMKTVWITRAAGKPAYVDVKLRSVRELPRALSRLLASAQVAPRRESHRGRAFSAA